MSCARLRFPTLAPKPPPIPSTQQVCKDLGKHLNLEIMVSTGGSALKDDILRLYNTVHIIVATPGRVLDMAEKGVAKLDACHIICLDEAEPGRALQRAGCVAAVPQHACASACRYMRML